MESDGYRGGLKRKADAITRTQYEDYSFSTKHNLSEARRGAEYSESVHGGIKFVTKSIL